MVPTALLAALCLSPTADAAFGGKVKNIRIRERNNSQGYRVVVVVDDDSDHDVSDLEATLSFTAADGGPALDDVTLTTSRRARLAWQAADVDLGGVQDDGALPIALTINGSLEADAGTITVEAGLSVDGAWEEVALGETGKLSVRLTEDPDTGLGLLEARVFSEDRDWDPSGVTGVSAVLSNGSESLETALEAAGFKAHLVGTWSDDALAASGFTYAVTTTLSDAEGVLDTRSEQLAVAAPGFDDGITKTRYRRRGGSRYKVVTITGSDEDQPLQGLLTEVTDAEGAVLLSSFDESPVAVERDYTAVTTFDSSPAGQTFAVTLTLRDAEGTTIGLPVSGALTLPSTAGARSDDLVLDLPVLGEAADCCTINGVLDAEGDVGLELSLTGEGLGAVASAELQFDEPFEGAVPQENPLTLGFAVEWHKWVDSFDSDTLGDADVTIDQGLFSEDGEVMDETLWTGFPGRTYQNGTGTRLAVTNVGGRPSLL